MFCNNKKKYLNLCTETFGYVNNYKLYLFLMRLLEIVLLLFLDLQLVNIQKKLGFVSNINEINENLIVWILWSFFYDRNSNFIIPSTLLSVFLLILTTSEFPLRIWSPFLSYKILSVVGEITRFSVI